MTKQHKNPIELIFGLNQKSKSANHYRAIWNGDVPLKVPEGFRFRNDEIGLRPYMEAIEVAMHHRAGRTLLTPEPRSDASALLADLGASGFALVNQSLYLQESMTLDGNGIKNIKFVARYLFRDRNDLFEDEQELDSEVVRIWVHNLISLTTPFLWEVTAFENPTTDELFKTHIRFAKRTERPKQLPGVKYAPNLLRLDQGAFVLKAA